MRVQRQRLNVEKIEPRFMLAADSCTAEPVPPPEPQPEVPTEIAVVEAAATNQIAVAEPAETTQLTGESVPTSIEGIEQKLGGAAEVDHVIRLLPGEVLSVEISVALTVPTQIVYDLQLEEPTDPTADTPALIDGPYPPPGGAIVIPQYLRLEVDPVVWTANGVD